MVKQTEQKDELSNAFLDNLFHYIGVGIILLFLRLLD